MELAIDELRTSEGKSLKVVEDILSIICPENNTGLEADDLQEILEILTSSEFEKCAGGVFQKVLFACVPKGFLSNDIVDIPLVWFLSVFRNHSVTVTKVNAMLDWLIGLLEFGLIDRNHVDLYYNLYYSFLTVTKAEKLGSKLLYMLSRPADIYRGRVELVLKCHNVNGKAKHTSALLSLFKMLKPELVPESVQFVTEQSAFRSIPDDLKAALALARERMLNQGDFVNTKINNLHWKGPSFKKTDTKCAIPVVSYTHLGSELYGGKKRKIVEFVDIESLACNQLSIELPSSILSLLVNQGGMLLLATPNRDVDVRFSNVLFSWLNSAFIENIGIISYEERDYFLKKLVEFENYTMQGIPVVSRFLSLYIVIWNGLDHRQYIYRLLERITISSFEEFSQCILDYLQTIFLSADVEHKCTIINTFRKIIFNHVNSVTSQKVPQEHYFLGKKREWVDVSAATISQLVCVASDYCQQALLFEQNHPMLLHSALSLYETLLELQIDSEQEITVLPPFIFYRALFSPDMSALSRACGLLLRYKAFEQRLNRGSRESCKSAKCLNDYSCDVWNCFKSRKAFTKGEQGYIFRDQGRRLQLVYERDSVFALENHLVTYGLGEQVKQLGLSTHAALSPEAFENVFRTVFPAISRFLEVINGSYSEYHRS